MNFDDSRTSSVTLRPQLTPADFPPHIEPGLPPWRTLEDLQNEDINELFRKYHNLYRKALAYHYINGTAYSLEVQPETLAPEDPIMLANRIAYRQYLCHLGSLRAQGMTAVDEFQPTNNAESEDMPEGEETTGESEDTKIETSSSGETEEVDSAIREEREEGEQVVKEVKLEDESEKAKETESNNVKETQTDQNQETESDELRETEQDEVHDQESDERQENEPDEGQETEPDEEPEALPVNFYDAFGFQPADYFSLHAIQASGPELLELILPHDHYLFGRLVGKLMPPGRKHNKYIRYLHHNSRQDIFFFMMTAMAMYYSKRRTYQRNFQRLVTASNKFTRREMMVHDYYNVLTTVMGYGALRYMCYFLIALCPDIKRQHILFEYHLRKLDSRSPKYVPLSKCACGQLVLTFLWSDHNIGHELLRHSDIGHFMKTTSGSKSVTSKYPGEEGGHVRSREEQENAEARQRRHLANRLSHEIMRREESTALEDAGPPSYSAQMVLRAPCYPDVFNRPIKSTTNRRRLHARRLISASGPRTPNFVVRPIMESK